VPIVYGQCKVGYDLVYLNTKSGDDDLTGDPSELLLTAIGVISEGPISGATKYYAPNGDEFDIDEWYATGDDTPIFGIDVINGGMPSPDLQVSAAAASGSTWGYRIAYTYFGGAMPFGATPEVTVNGAATPANTISWTIPINDSGYAMVGAVTIFRTTSPNEGTYPLGCIGQVKYNTGTGLPLTRVLNPTTATLDDTGQALTSVMTIEDPAPCSLMPGTAFVVLTWYRNNPNMRTVEFPRLLVQGRLLADPDVPTDAALTATDATVTVADTTGLAAGMAVYGTGIPYGAHILSVTDATHFELTAAATITDASTNIYIASNYSTNPALQLLDLKLSTQYGDGVPWGDIDTASITTAVDYCDTVIAGEGNRKTATSGIQLREVKSGEDWQRTIGLAAGLYWKFSAGQWALVIEQTGAPVRTLTVDDLLESPTLRRTAFKGLRDLPNRATVEWTDPSTDGAWRVRTVSVQAAEVDQGAEIREGSNYSFHQIQNEYEAYAAAWRVLNTITLDLTIVAKLMPEHQDLAVGDIVAVTYGPLGMTAKKFRITGLDRDDTDDSLVLSGTEYEDTIYTYAAVTINILGAAGNNLGFADDFASWTLRDQVYESTWDYSTPGQRSKVLTRVPGFEYLLLSPPTAYSAIRCYYWPTESVAAKTWSELEAAIGSGAFWFDDPNVTGGATNPELWDADITAGYFAVASPGSWHTKVTTVETLGSDNATVVSTTTTTETRGMTVRWKLVSANGEVSTATGVVYHMADDSSSDVTTDLGTVPPIPVINVTAGDTLTYAPSISFAVPDSDFTTYPEASYSGTGDCTVTGDDGESSWASPFAGAIVLDTGVAGRRFKGLYFKASGTNGAETTDVVIAYSSNGSSWTNVTGFTARVAATWHYQGGANLEDDNTPNYATWSDPGAAYRYWRLTNGAGASKIRETSAGVLHSLSGLRWFSMDAAATTEVASSFVLRRITGGSIDYGVTESEILATIPRASIPTSGQPLDIRPWVILEQHDSSDTPPLSYPFDCHFVSFSVRTRNANGDESSPVFLTIQWQGDATEAFPTVVQRSFETVPERALAGSLGLVGAVASEERVETPTLRLNAAPISGSNYTDLISDGLNAAGWGAASATPAAITHRLGQKASGTNVAGGEAILHAGLGTGTAAPALLRVRTSTVQASGTTLHGTQDRVVIGGKNITLTDNSATAVLTVDCSVGAGMHSLRLTGRLFVSDGTDYQPGIVVVDLNVANKAGTVTGTAAATLAYHPTSGTLAVTPSVTVAGTTATLKLNANSSLAATISLAPIEILTAGPYTVAFA